MIGLSILGVLLLVTVLTIWIFISVIKQAKRKGKNPYLHGGIVAIILFFLITWDWIPSEIYYAYQCKQLPPMQVYKTPEQWIAENQDLIAADKERLRLEIERIRSLPEGNKKLLRLEVRRKDGLTELEYLEREGAYIISQEGFKINGKKDLPQVSKEGYLLTNSFINKWFASATYSAERKSILRTYYVKGMLFDRRTGDVLIEQISYLQNVRFDSPPLYTGGKKCSFYDKNNNIYHELKNKYFNIKEK